MTQARRRFTATEIAELKLLASRRGRRHGDVRAFAIARVLPVLTHADVTLLLAAGHNPRELIDAMVCPHCGGALA